MQALAGHWKGEAERQAAFAAAAAAPETQEKMQALQVRIRPGIIGCRRIHAGVPLLVPNASQLLVQCDASGCSNPAARLATRGSLCCLQDHNLELQRVVVEQELRCGQQEAAIMTLQQRLEAAEQALAAAAAALQVRAAGSFVLVLTFTRCLLCCWRTDLM